MIMAKFKTVYKKQLADAYKLSYATLMQNLCLQFKRMDAEDKKKLGKWQGKKLLLPQQVAVIVKYLGEPEDETIIMVIN